MSSENVAIVLEENVEKARQRTGRYEQGLFSRELQRMREYDEEVCPERLKPALEYIKQNGWHTREDVIELFKRFGERQWKFPVSQLELLANCINAFVIAGKIVGNLKRFKLETPLDSVYRSSGNDEFKLDDEIPGFSKILGHQDYGKISGSTESVELVGVPNETTTKYKIGELSIKELAPFGRRRFMYIFGVEPSEEREICNTLVKLNKLPADGSRVDGDHTVRYSLKSRTLKQLKPPRAAELVYDEAQAARDLGLFSDVKVYELVGEHVEIPKRDPVIVGIDHFGNQHPVIYWAGDKGLGGS